MGSVAVRGFEKEKYPGQLYEITRYDFRFSIGRIYNSKGVEPEFYRVQRLIFYSLLITAPTD
jgi:lipocalin